MIPTNQTIRSLFLEGPAGRLEALLNAGAENATHAAVVCHPHPLFGGTLHNMWQQNKVGARWEMRAGFVAHDLNKAFVAIINAA